MRTLLALLLLAACAQSHGNDEDGGTDTGTDSGDRCGPSPGGIYCLWECCTDSGPALVCEGGDWVCPAGSRHVDECPFCPTMCGGPAPGCIALGPDACCTGEFVRPATCDGARWSCPPGSVTETACASAPSCSSACEGTGHGACVDAVECTPFYDDACCPFCSDVGFCADCTDIVFEGCATREDRCFEGTPSCGLLAPDACTGGPGPDCRMAFPTSADGCTIAGCVPAVEAGCDDCLMFCTRVEEGACTPSCRADPPPCPFEMIPEGRDGCYSGLCIPGSVCEAVPLPPGG